MMHLISLLICVTAFAALALATDRAQSDLLGRELPVGTTRGLRVVGWTLLVVSLAIVVEAKGWGLGLVSYSGHTSLAAGVVFLGLVVRGRWGR